MYCEYCGSKNDKLASNCANCGAALKHESQFSKSAKKIEDNSAFILAVLSLIFSLMVSSILGIIFSAIAKKKYQESIYMNMDVSSSTLTFAKAGLWIGIITLILKVFLVFSVFLPLLFLF